MSVWEQRASQLRRHNLRASSEALYNELDPEEQLRMSSALHIRPDMKTHLDRPLVVEPHSGPMEQQRTGEKGEGGTPEEGAMPSEAPVHPRRHYRHRERPADEANENGELGNGREGRHHVHHSRSKDHDGCRGKEGKGERSHSREGGRRHHHQALADEAGGTGEKEQRRRHARHHHKEGNGTVNNGEKSERRARHKEGSRSANREGERGAGGNRGENGGNGERRRHKPRPPKSPSALEGDVRKEREDNRVPGLR